MNNLESHKGQLKWEDSFFEVDQYVEIMAMKKSEDGQYNVIRLLNGSSQSLDDIKVRVPVQVKKCYISNVKEEKGEELKIDHQFITIPHIKAQDFITLLYK